MNVQTTVAAPARRRPLWAVGLVAYALAWTVLPALLATSLPLDVVEGIAWGREWQWGYFKHPPLPAWLLYPAFEALGRFGPFLLSQLAVLLALFYVHRLARQMLGPERAGLAAALLYGVLFYTWPMLTFNHNSAQVPVWAALAWHAHQALQRDRRRDWAWLGVWAAIGLYTKYSTGVFLACLAVYLLVGPERRLLRRPGPWLALVVALALLVPHGLWLLHDDGGPLAYLAARSQGDPAAANHASGLRFLATQFVALVPLGLIAWAAGLRPSGGHLYLQEPSRRAWLLTIALGPALAVAVGGSLTGAELHDMWGMPMWNFSALLLLAAVPPQVFAHRRRALARALAVWLVLITLAMAAYVSQSARWLGRPGRMDWPAQALGDQAQRQWQALSRCPLQVVAGSIWEAGLVAEQQRPMPSVLIDGDARYAPWISAAHVQQTGALLVWRLGDYADAPEAPLLAAVPPASWRISEGQWSIAWPRNTGGAPLQIRWRAYVPIACQPS